jgi:aryl-alcohol dehydrogenase-like predicted oxidoreductase
MSATSLATVPLGRTDMTITRVGFGAWAIGGGDWSFAWGHQDDDESVAAIRYAVDAGVNWIDTAAVYGLGHSEEVVARAVAAIPDSDRPYVFTKGGLIWDPKDRRRPAARVAAPASLRRQVEGSLRRLRVERIDLYQLHWPAEDGTALEEYWQTFLDLKAEGKVRAVGLSNHSAKQLEAAEAVGHVDTLQPPFSAIHRDVAAEELPWCQEHETGVIVYSPMQAGLLTGAFTAERVHNLPEDDWRRRHPDFQGEALAANMALADAFAPIAARYGVAPAAVAVAWTLAWPGVTAAIVGARRPEQIDGWLPAASLTLDDDDLTAVADAIEATGAGTGPADPRHEGDR